MGKLYDKGLTSLLAVLYMDCYLMLIHKLLTISSFNPFPNNKFWTLPN